MTKHVFRVLFCNARRHLATRRLLSLYRDIRRLVELLAIRADCAANSQTVRRKVVRLRDARIIGADVSCKVNKLSTMVGRAGEVKLGELLDLVRCAAKQRRKLANIERNTRSGFHVPTIAASQPLDLHPVCGTVKGGAV